MRRELLLKQVSLSFKAGCVLPIVPLGINTLTDQRFALAISQYNYMQTPTAFWFLGGKEEKIHE